MGDWIESAAQAIAEAMNGGEFNNGKWYTERHREAWRKAVGPALRKARADALDEAAQVAEEKASQIWADGEDAVLDDLAKAIRSLKEKQP